MHAETQTHPKLSDYPGRHRPVDVRDTYLRLQAEYLRLRESEQHA